MQAWYASVLQQIDGKNIGLVLGPHYSKSSIEKQAEAMPHVGFAVVSSFRQAIDVAADWQNNPAYRRNYDYMS